MEELPGAIYLFNLSLLSVTFAVVSALVMLVRQTMGQADQFRRPPDHGLCLVRIYHRLQRCFAALGLPLRSPPVVLWAISSGLAAVLHGGVLGNTVRLRRKVSKEPMSSAVAGSFATHGVVIAVLVINALVPPVQGVGPFAAALTVALGIMMWTFVRRISSLLGDKPGDDWDPKRG